MRRILVPAVLVLLAAACNDDTLPYYWFQPDGSGEGDTALDAADGSGAADAGDTTEDPTTDNGPDTGDDTVDPGDTGVDTAVDTDPDTGIDSGIDSGDDTAIDTWPDTWADTALDTSCVPDCGGRECGYDPVCGTMFCGSCTGFEVCESGVCGCGPGRAECGGECTNIYSTSACGEDCVACLSGQVCDGRGCVGPTEGAIRIDGATGALVAYHDGSWRGVCDDNFDALDADVVCRQLEGTLVSWSTGLLGPTGLFWMDDLACIGSESELADCAFAGWGVENCSEVESVTVVCEPFDRTPSECTPGAADGTVINEVLYDTIGTDTDGAGEFIELYGPPNAEVGELTIRHVNGATWLEIWRWTLPAGARLDSNGFLLVGGAGVPGADYVRTGPIQNGPDSLVLLDCTGERLDAVAYGDFSTAFPDGEGDPALDQAEGVSINRFPDGWDSNDNYNDFTGLTPTPGAPNDLF